MKIFLELLQIAKNIERVLIGISETLANGREQPRSEVWLDDYDLMQKFNISRTTLYRLRQDNILKAYKLGGKSVYLEDEVVEALKENQKQ